VVTSGTTPSAESAESTVWEATHFAQHRALDQRFSDNVLANAFDAGGAKLGSEASACSCPKVDFVTWQTGDNNLADQEQPSRSVSQPTKPRGPKGGGQADRNHGVARGLLDQTHGRPLKKGVKRALFAWKMIGCI